MNLDTIWQLHKRFIIGVVIGLIVFMIGLAIIGKTAGAQLSRSQIAINNHKRTLAKPAYTRAQVNDLRERLATAQARTSELAQAALPPLRERYALSAGSSPTEQYIEVTASLRTELIGWALRQNVDIDQSLGLPAQSPTQPQKIARVLRGLDVVERVCRLAVLTGAIEVESISIDSRTPRNRRGKQGPALDLTPILLEVVFTEVSPRAFLEAILEEGDGMGPFGLIRWDLAPKDKRKKERRVTLEFAAGALPVATPEEDVL